MKLSRNTVPNVHQLLEGEDVDALIEAARFQDFVEIEGQAADRGVDVREQAVLALGKLGSEAGNGAVAAALKDPFDSVRSAAVRVLYARADAVPLANALEWLPADGTSSRTLAAEALLKLADKEAAGAAVAALVRAPGEAPLSDADVELIRSVARPEGRARPVKAVVHELVSALSDERDAVAERAEELLVEMGPASTRAMIAELEAGGSPERAAAILGRIADTSSLDPLLGALERPETDVRAQAAAALGALCHAAAVEPLMRATEDPELKVRTEASYALDRMGTAAVIVGMRAALEPMIAEAVASAVGEGRPNGNGHAVLRLAPPGASEGPS